MTPEEIIDDLLRIDYGDKAITQALDTLRALHKQKGLVYRELMKSKLYSGRVKYLVLETGKKFTICDLDTNEEFTI